MTPSEWQAMAAGFLVGAIFGLVAALAFGFREWKRGLDDGFEIGMDGYKALRRERDSALKRVAIIERGWREALDGWGDTTRELDDLKAGIRELAGVGGDGDEGEG